MYLVRYRAKTLKQSLCFRIWMDISIQYMMMHRGGGIHGNCKGPYGEGYAPDKTIRFCVHGAEEWGLKAANMTGPRI